MAGPVIKTKPLPEWIDPATKSVFDPFYEQLLKRAVSVMGLDTPKAWAEASLPGMNPLVAGVAPQSIPMLKQAGKGLLEEIMNSGELSRVTRGRKLSSFKPPILGDSRWRELLGLKQKPIPQTVPLYPEAVKAFEYAQKRWPRLFGHLADITDVSTERGKNIFGSYVGRPNKFGILQFSPTANKPRLFGLVPDEGPNTIGHELLHVADNITMPEFGERYNFSSSLPGGYKNNSFEIRARIQGENLKNELKYGQQAVRKDRIARIKLEKAMRKDEY